MILLHNTESAHSRALADSAPAGCEVIDWYGDEAARAAFQAAHPTLSPGAFPSVLVDVPAYAETVMAYDEEGNLTGMEEVARAASETLLRSPVSWGAVDQFNAFTAARATE